jgi:23S rRNA pseudouridine1911/1915/1917 synthase
VLFSDPRFIAVFKPAGVPVQPDRTGDPSLHDLVQAEHPTAMLVHRIDRPVSGVVLFALDGEAAAALSALFSEGRAEKIYWAIVHGRMEGDGEWEHRIVEDPRARKARIDDRHGAPVRTFHRSLAIGERYTLVELRPHQGRFHQLRAQCAAAGHPIKGDVKYGARRGEKDRSIGLHARSLRFPHPFRSGEVRIQAGPEGPQWDALLNILGAGTFKGSP